MAASCHFAHDRSKRGESGRPGVRKLTMARQNAHLGRRALLGVIGYRPGVACCSSQRYSSRPAGRASGQSGPSPGDLPPGSADPAPASCRGRFPPPGAAATVCCRRGWRTRGPRGLDVALSHLLVGPHVVVPIIPLTHVGRGEFPVFLGLVQSREEAFFCSSLDTLSQNFRITVPLRARWASCSRMEVNRSRQRCFAVDVSGAAAAGRGSRGAPGPRGPLRSNCG